MEQFRILLVEDEKKIADSMISDCEQIQKILSASIRTVKGVTR